MSITARARHFAAALLVPLLCAGAQTGVRYTTVSIPMRDGKSLEADVYANDDSVAKPVILIQTPYNKNLYRITVNLPPQAGGASFPYDSAKYNYVTVDWRGFYGSKDAAVANYDRGLDGADCVEWIAARPWCDGRIGTWGPSALGAIQFLTARQHPPHLVCCMPLVKDFKTKYGDYYYQGVYRKEHVESLEKLGFLSTSIILSQPDFNAIWRAVETGSDTPGDFAVPMLVVGGWFDHFPDDVLRAFEDLRTRSDPSVRDAHKLILGPWTHSGVDDADQGELSFPNAVDVARAAAFRFYDRYLRGTANGWDAEPVVRYYEMGTDAWHDAQSWTGLARASATYYLAPDSALVADAPAGSQAFTAFRADPRDPSPSYGAARFNPFDPSVVAGPLDLRTVVESRDDCIRFTTAPLDRALSILGPTEVDLWVSTDRTDADVSVRLCDVYPDGRSMIMTDGIARLRFRDGVDHEVSTTPGDIVPVTVGLQNLALTLPAGHRLRIDLAGADYPRFDVNLNNGGPMYVAGDTLVATTRIYHDAGHPSHLTLAVPTTPVRVAPPPSPGAAHLDVFPNPAHGRIVLRYAADAGRAVVRVSDLLGRSIVVRTVEIARVGSSETSITLPRVPAGLYYVCVTTARGRWLSPVVVR
jgi:predicted acyl esterase